MRKKGIVVGIIILFVGASVFQVSAIDFHSVYGFVYINNSPAPAGVEVKLTFDDGEESDLTDSNGYYQIDWASPNNEHEWHLNIATSRD